MTSPNLRLALTIALFAALGTTHDLFGRTAAWIVLGVAIGAVTAAAASARQARP